MRFNGWGRLGMDHLNVKPGDRVVVVGEEAQEAVGGKEGVVVGTTAPPPDPPKVIVAIDEGPATNAVIDLSDIEIETNAA
jgi:hypothetical protein